MTEPGAALVAEAFTLRHFAYELGVFLPAPPPKVWQALTLDIDHWWNYRLRDRTRCIIEPGVGGRWMQAWDSGGALFGTFTVWDPPNVLVVNGPLAMTTPAHNRLELELVPADTGTKMWIRHQAYGDFEPETPQIYANGWDELIGRSLYRYVDSRR